MCQISGLCLNTSMHPYVECCPHGSVCRCWCAFLCVLCTFVCMCVCVLHKKM